MRAAWIFRRICDEADIKPKRKSTASRVVQSPAAGQDAQRREDFYQKYDVHSGIKDEAPCKTSEVKNEVSQKEGDIFDKYIQNEIRQRDEAALFQNNNWL